MPVSLSLYLTSIETLLTQDMMSQFSTVWAGLKCFKNYLLMCFNTFLK